MSSCIAVYNLKPSYLVIYGFFMSYSHQYYYYFFFFIIFFSLTASVLLFLQENGFEFDLAPFACRQVEISFAVATNGMAVSNYSPSTTILLSDHGKSSLACPLGTRYVAAKE